MNASAVTVEPEDELKQLLKASRITMGEKKEIETLYMRANTEDGMAGESTLWKLTQGISAIAREAEPTRARELHELAGNLLVTAKPMHHVTE